MTTTDLPRPRFARMYVKAASTYLAGRPDGQQLDASLHRGVAASCATA